MHKNTPSTHFIIDVQNNYPSNTSSQLPTESLLQHWACAVLEQEQLLAAELTLRLVDAEEMQSLNAQFRGKNMPTNVLSFPAQIPADIPLDIPLLGDVILCVSVIEREAKEQGTLLLAHWAHMVIHGTLHLLGYDHQDDKEADVMEAKEIFLLQQLNYPDPYSEK